MRLPYSERRRITDEVMEWFKGHPETLPSCSLLRLDVDTFNVVTALAALGYLKTEEEVRTVAPGYLSQALNEGDGVYKP